MFGFLITPFFAQIIRFFPPVVTGIVITAIGLTLMPVAGNWIMGGNASADDYGSVKGVGLAGLTLLIVIVCSKIGSGMLSRLAVLVGLVAGTLVAIPMGIADFSGRAGGRHLRTADPVRIRLARVPRRLDPVDVHRCARDPHGDRG